jgi:hypothetical protein
VDDHQPFGTFETQTGVQRDDLVRRVHVDHLVAVSFRHLERLHHGGMGTVEKPADLLGCAASEEVE